MANTAKANMTLRPGCISLQDKDRPTSGDAEPSLESPRILPLIHQNLWHFEREEAAILGAPSEVEMEETESTMNTRTTDS